MSEHVIVEAIEGVLRVQLNRPEKRNALTVAMYGAIADAIERVESSDELRVAYLTGTPGCFTAGNDILDFMSPSQAGVQVLRFLEALSTTQKPIVAGVSGLAVGIGVTMLMHCDLVYAAQSATFRTPFVDLGLCPEAASSLLMPRAMGHQRATEILVLGETLSAERARDYGLVNALFEDDVLDEQALKKARHLATRAPAAVRAAKGLLKRPLAAAVQETMAAEMEVLGERITSPELMEAVTAFMQHREPDFSKFS